MNSNFNVLYGMYNRKTLCFDDFVIFKSLDDLTDYYRALYDLFISGKYTDFQFADFVLYPFDYTVYEIVRLDKIPHNSCDCIKDIVCEPRGDFSDLLNIKKESDDDGKRESDIYDSESVYSDSEPRA